MSIANLDNQIKTFHEKLEDAKKRGKAFSDIYDNLIAICECLEELNRYPFLNAEISNDIILSMEEVTQVAKDVFRSTERGKDYLPF